MLHAPRFFSRFPLVYVIELCVVYAIELAIAMLQDNIMTMPPNELLDLARQVYSSEI